MPNNNSALMASIWLKWVTPNQLTAVRILVIPPLLVLIYLGGPVFNWIAFGLYFIGCITDFFDGILARYRDEVSPMGKLLDPIADKMLVSACLVMLVAVGGANVVPAIVILMREFAVSGLRQVAALEGIAVAAMPGAKYKTTVQMLSVGFLLVRHESFAFPSVEIGRVLLWVAMVWTLWTGYGYFRDYYRGH